MAAGGELNPRTTADETHTYSHLRQVIVGRKLQHRQRAVLNNFMEQSHCVIQQRYYPMRGFGSFASASGFCTDIDELSDD